MRVVFLPGSLVLVLALLLPASARADVIGDDERDRYVGTGSVILPGGVPETGRRVASDCPGCDWKATIVCEMASASSCRGAVRLCQGEHEFLRYWVKRPGEDWQMLGMGCVGPGGPPPREAVDRAARDRFVAGLPKLAPRAQPPSGALVALPVGLRSGQSAVADREWDLLGVPVTLQVEPVWTWTFGDGTHLTTREPGDRWPRLTVAHTYARPGVYRARVVTTVSATYTVEGLVPFPVVGQIHQSRGLSVRVGEARAVLVR
jgi:hypothetical protein